MIHIRNILLALFAFGCISACSEKDIEPATAKNSENQRRWYRNGPLAGEEGGIIFGGRNGGSESGSGAGLGVNSFLWRATLDTLSFMPLASADPFGGVIITDWYEDPATPGERFKVNAIILDKALRSDGVKITLFKQMMKSGTWRDIQIDKTVEQSLVNTILTRARELKVAQLK